MASFDSPFRANDPRLPGERLVRWLELQGKTPAHHAAWCQGVMPAELARRAAAPGDDVLTVASGVITVTGAVSCLVAFFVAATWAWLMAGGTLILGLALMAFARSVNPAARMGYGRVERFRSKGRVVDVPVRGEDDEPRTFHALRWRLPSGVELETILARDIVEEVRTSDGGTFELFVVERRGAPVLLAVLPP